MSGQGTRLSLTVMELSKRKNATKKSIQLWFTIDINVNFRLKVLLLAMTIIVNKFPAIKWHIDCLKIRKLVSNGDKIIFLHTLVAVFQVKILRKV